jgi:hypothetical protein
MQDKWKDKGLVVIVVHCQNVPKETVVGFMASKGTNFSVYGGGKVKGGDFEGIPYVFVFDPAGAIQFEGRYSGMESKVEELCKTAPDWLTGPKEWTKVKAEADKLRSRKGMGQAVADLRKKEQAEGDAKEEAGELLDRVTRFAEREMKRAETAAEAGDPLKSQDIWTRLARDFKGDEIGTQADTAAKEKGKDPAFQKEVDAAKQLAKLETIALTIKPRRNEEAPDKWRQKNAAVIAQIVGIYKSMEKKFADTKVFARAKARVNSMSLE